MKNRENEKAETERLYCNQCKHHTIHVCQASYTKSRKYFEGNLIRITDGSEVEYHEFDEYQEY